METNPDYQKLADGNRHWSNTGDEQIARQHKDHPSALPWKNQTLGWQPSCECGLEPVPCTVFDPFSGSGTVGLVSLPLGRNYLGIELNPDYCAMARRRLQNERGLIAKETT